jgi:hypothetical protein
VINIVSATIHIRKSRSCSNNEESIYDSNICEAGESEIESRSRELRPRSDESEESKKENRFNSDRTTTMNEKIE